MGGREGAAAGELCGATAPCGSTWTAFTTRLVTQMYFPGDPLFRYDPIFNSVRDPQARERMIARFDIGTTESQWALAYRFEIVLRGREAARFEH